MRAPTWASPIEELYGAAVNMAAWAESRGAVSWWSSRHRGPSRGRRRHLHEPSDETTHRPPSRNRLELTVSRLMKSGFLAAVIATLSAASLVVLAAPASSSGSPLDITYISSLTGPGASEYANSQLGCVARVDLQNAEGGIEWEKGESVDPGRRDEPDTDFDRGQKRNRQGCGRDRRQLTALLFGREIRPTGRDARDRKLFRWSRVGGPALHQHVRCVPGERRSGRSSEQHLRKLFEVTWGNDYRHLRLRRVPELGRWSHRRCRSHSSGLGARSA